ncbi:ribonuclease III [Phosphitispora sp. TUW77]|uniref:ribonuclease III n=1 Tax=Phosphitispora sp. TUW77 TaxID=3152361 RepID=UPI003AB7BF7D
MNDLNQLKANLGIVWDNNGHLCQALTHSSYAHENRSVEMEHNQRLEFLGDAVLELVISDYIYRKYPQYPEGVLTKIRAGIVCEPSLAKVAGSLYLGDYLYMGKGEERSGGRERPSILADAMESLIGAIYLDHGLETAYKFILDKLGPVIERVIKDGGMITDYKTHLQELVQKHYDSHLSYDIIKEYGPDHCKTFVAGVSIMGKLWGTGTGRTKKEAEQLAAKDALLKIDNGAIDLIGSRNNE